MKNKKLLVYTRPVDNKKIVRHGFISELARTCNCHRHTVRAAIYENAVGEKADRVRRVFRKNYQSIEI